jgi:hypothetical protein
MNTIVEATQDYETWLEKQIPVLKDDLAIKHQHMAENSFSFFRATFYRWIQWYHDLFQNAPAVMVLSVGDLHAENFGTWRDSQGRLVWGINDFDEAARLPYTQDLIRLAASLLLAADEKLLSAEGEEICTELWDAYSAIINSESDPYVLEERHTGLRELVLSNSRDPVSFWTRLDSFKTIDSVPKDIEDLLKSSIPQPVTQTRIIHRIAGLGSLGRPRYTLIAGYFGSKIAREVKMLAPSCGNSYFPDSGAEKNLYEAFIQNTIRVNDPFLKISGNLLIRRLAPDCGRIDLKTLADKKDELRLIKAMGRETGNIHWIDSGIIPDTQNDMHNKDAKWLHQAARHMNEKIQNDWLDWKKYFKKHS